MHSQSCLSRKATYFEQELGWMIWLKLLWHVLTCSCVVSVMYVCQTASAFKQLGACRCSFVPSETDCMALWWSSCCLWQNESAVAAIFHSSGVWLDVLLVCMIKHFKHFTHSKHSFQTFNSNISNILCCNGWVFLHCVQLLKWSWMPWRRGRQG